MLLKYPRDLTEYPQYRKLLKTMDAAGARWVFGEFWDFMGYCCSMTGKAGVLPKHLVPTFEGRYEEFNDLNPMAMLNDAGWFEEEKDFWFCPMFSKYNFDLDSDFVSESTIRNRIVAFQNQLEKLKGEAKNTVDLFPPEWFNVSDRPAGKQEMNRVVIFIRTLDILTTRGAERSNEEWTRGLLTRAVEIIRKFPPDKMKAILKACWFRKQTRDFPRDTDFIIAHWEDTVWRIMPDDGWGRWRDRSEFERTSFAESEA